MRKIYTILFLSILGLSAKAQTFSSSGTVHIDDNAQCYLPINVNGLQTSMNTSFGIISTCVDIKHSYAADIKIFLISPQLDSVLLSSNNGGGGDNYTNTCFTENATSSIGLVSNLPPYTGSFYPEYSLNFFNTAGHNPNGVWKIKVKDEAPGDTGRVQSVTITFGANPPVTHTPPAGPCSFNSGANCHCPDGSTDCDLLPDMTSSSKIIQDYHTEYSGYLTMSNATPNIGWGPMEIHGVDTCYCGTNVVPCNTSVCPDGSAVKQMIKQRLYHKNGGTITSYDRTAGTMSYHPTHGHIHVDSWASYTLREATNDPNPLNWPIVGTGTKQSFCLINLGDCTNNLGYCVGNNGNVWTMDSIPNAPLGTVSGCSVDQGIYTGKLDIYSQGMVGQNIQFGDICNGDYYIVSITDPDDWFLEQDETNNYVAVPITLTDQKPLPTANFNFAISGLSVALNADTLHTQHYWWDFGDGSPADSANLIFQHNYLNVGTYTVKFYAMNACGTTVKTQIITIAFVGINDLGNSNTQFFTVAPNPTNSSTNISYYLMAPSNSNIQIFDVLGNVVKTISNGYQPAGKYSFTFDPLSSGVAKGTYFLKYNSNDKVHVTRVVYE